MNREIKFRAWQPFTSLHRKKGMYVVDHLAFYEPDAEGHTGEAFLAKSLGWSQSSEYIEDIKLMQYTGLKDSHDKTDAYEGDVVSNRNGSKIGVIVWHQPSCGFAIDWKDDGPLGSLSSWFGIIGNIHENPDLLEATS